MRSAPSSVQSAPPAADEPEGAGRPVPVARRPAGDSPASLTDSHALLEEPGPDLIQASRDTSAYAGLKAEEHPSSGLLKKMEDTGLEPVTFALPARRSPN